MKKKENLKAPPLSFSGIEESWKRNGLKSNEIAPRKKILGERNGVSSCPNSPEKPAISNPHEVSCGSAGSDITNTSNHRFRISPLISSSSSKISKSDHGERKGENKSAPYDPTTNFLSPRPKFLRYNPKWRRKVVLTREKIEDLSSDVDSQGDTEQEESSVSTSVSSSLSSLAGDQIKDETCGDVDESDGVEIQDDDVEEEEEEVRGSFKGLKWALKLLLVLSVLFLSTAYISTMNSPTPPPAVQTLRGLRDEYQRVGAGLLENLFKMNKFHGSDELGLGLFEIEVSDHSEMVVEDEDVEEEIAQQLGEVAELDERGFEGDSHGESEEIGKEMSYDVAVDVGNGGIFEVVNDSFDGLQSVEEVIETEANVVSDESEKLDGSSTNEESIFIHGSSIDSYEEKLTQNEEINDEPTQKEGVNVFEVGNDSFDGLPIVEEVIETEANVVSDESEELDGSSTNEESISSHGSSIDSYEEEKLTQNEEINDEPTQKEGVNVFEVGNDSFDGLPIVEEVIETEANVVSDESEELDGSSTNEESISSHGSSIDSYEEEKLTQKEAVNDGLTQKEEVSDGPTQKEEVNYGVEQKKSETFLKLKVEMLGLTTTVSTITTKDPIFVAVLSLLVAVGASLALRFHFNCKKTPSKPSSYPVAAEARVPKKAPCLPPTPPRPRECITPQVKLLGELDFGDVSSPVQNYNHTGNQRYVSISPTHSLRYSVGSEDWTMDSAASYGSFITEEKITQKKEGKQVAAAADMGLSGTPVRRSMRIRNRKVTSP